jgi:phosphoenolpyruvate synthase/pyruvate phosphate dikinase
MAKEAKTVYNNRNTLNDLMMDNTTNSQLLLKEIAAQLGENYLLAQTFSSELVQFPTPLTASLLEKLFSFAGSLGLAYRELGLPMAQYSTREYVHYILGRIYFNISVEDKNFWPQYGFTHTVENNRLKVEQKLPFVQKLMKSVQQAAAQSFIIAKQSDIVHEAVMLCDSLEALKRFPTEQKYDAQLFNAEIESFIADYKVVVKLAYLESILGDGYKSITVNSVHGSVDKYLESITALSTLNTADIAAFLTAFGNRSFNDFELSKERWYETPAVLMSLAKQSKSSERKENKTVAIPAFIILKNNVRYYLLNRVARIRQLICAFGSQHNIADVVCFMALDEMSQTTEQVKIDKRVLQSRKEKYEQEIKQYAPLFIYPAMPQSAWTMQAENSVAITATPVSAGISAGKCVVVTRPEVAVTEKSVLVLPTAGPEFTHLYSSASAIIFLQGGVLSHGSIIAREMKVPAVIAQGFSVAQGNASRVLTVDGTKGIIINDEK